MILKDLEMPDIKEVPPPQNRGMSDIQASDSQHWNEVKRILGYNTDNNAEVHNMVV